ncbi:MAG: hypothetical protein GXY52_04680 [Chloroflexi bacterium]|nr:hypothetical protein [Chloroflexota bacterium]
MRRIINGRVYDTDTAKLLADNEFASSDSNVAPHAGAWIEIYVTWRY